MNDYSLFRIVYSVHHIVAAVTFSECTCWTIYDALAIDKDWLYALSLRAPVARNDKVHLAEHSTQIEYPLLQLALPDGFSIVPLIIGSLGSDQMGMCERALCNLIADCIVLDCGVCGEDCATKWK